MTTRNKRRDTAKKCPGPAWLTGLGHVEFALRLPQAGPRLPVPARIAGAANRYSMGSSLPRLRIASVTGAATSRFRFGRQLHCVALMSELTSKCRRKVCQAESSGLRDLFFGKYHIAGLAAVAAAIGGVDVPICATNVDGRSVAEGACDAVDCGGAAFEFEEGANGCFIQVQVEAAKAKTGAVLFVAEGGFKAEARELGGPIVGSWRGDYFPFGTFFVTATFPAGAVLPQGAFDVRTTRWTRVLWVRVNPGAADSVRTRRSRPLLRRSEWGVS